MKALVLVEGGATAIIRIKGTAIPKEPVTNSIDSTDGVTLNQSRTNGQSTLNFKRVFDIAFTGGDANTSTTGGLVMVGTGDIANVNGFSDTGGAPNNFPHRQNEGFFNGIAGSDINIHHGKNGWGFFGSFFSSHNVLKNTANVNVSPFSFTMYRSTIDHSKLYKPLFYCVTMVTGVADATLEATDTFAGGAPQPAAILVMQERGSLLMVVPKRNG